jgi:hypothetical protein
MAKGKATNYGNRKPNPIAASHLDVVWQVLSLIPAVGHIRKDDFIDFLIDLGS